MTKKLLIFILAALLLLCSCGDSSEPFIAKNRSTPVLNTGEKVESAIFGRNISYSDSYTPAEGLTLPVESAEIVDMLQIGKTLYFLADGAVYTLDIESGESSKLFDTDAAMFAAYGETIYTYAPESGKLCSFTPGGEAVSEGAIVLQNEKLSVDEMFVTDDYYSFVCWDKSENIMVMQHHVFDRNTLQEVNIIDDKKTISTPYRVFSSYKGNCLLKVDEDPMDTRFVYVYEIDLETGSFTKLIEANIDNVNFISDIAYNTKTDTVVFFTAPRQKFNSLDDSLAGVAADPTHFTMVISEYSLSDPDNIVQKRFYHDNPTSANVFVSVYENIVSAISSADNEYRYFDYLNPPEGITLACQRSESYEDIIFGFEKETGIMVRTVSYGFDLERLDIKLMAGDTDFDLFEPVYLNQNKYFMANMFEDLSKYEGLKQRLDGDIAAGYVSNLDGKYVGIPTGMQNIGTKDVYPEDGSMWTYSNAISRFLYLAQNIDIADGVYKDSDGKELYKLLRYLYDNPNGNEAKMPFGNEINVLSNGFILMNPGGTHKENAVKFLEYMFDAMNGDIEDIVPEDEQYLNIDSTDDVYLYWRIYAWDYVEPIYEATNSISQCDGKNSTIKQIAREAAAQVRMRLEE